jgi:hypothetical protein
MYSIKSETYADHYFNYKNILTINAIPLGPLANHTKQINISPKRISAFRTNSEQNKCVYALYNSTTTTTHNENQLYTVETLPDFFTFCKTNGYTIETSLTQLLNNQAKQLDSVICYISYS